MVQKLTMMLKTSSLQNTPPRRTFVRESMCEEKYLIVQHVCREGGGWGTVGSSIRKREKGVTSGLKDLRRRLHMGESGEIKPIALS